MKLTPFRLMVLIFILVISSGLAVAQTPAPPEGGAARATPLTTVVRQAGTTASEDFELNIGERRITETNFEASTEVASGVEAAGRGLDLRVGVMVRASQIDVLLRNVQGRVRFRASLDPVLRLLSLRRVRPSATTPPEAQTNPSP